MINIKGALTIFPIAKWMKIRVCKMFDENEILLRILSEFCLKRHEIMNENLRFVEKFKPVCIPLSILIYSEWHCWTDIMLITHCNIYPTKSVYVCLYNINIPISYWLKGIWILNLKVNEVILFFLSNFFLSMLTLLNENI